MATRVLHLARLALLLVLVAGSSSVQAEPLGDTRFGIAEGWRNPSVMVASGAGWERVILPWDQIQSDGPDDFASLGHTISDEQLQLDVDRGLHVVGLLQFTPGWAAANPDAGLRSPPANLDLPFDDPNNYWGKFVAQTVSHYAGRIDAWILWNEPEFRPGDAGAGGSYTWLGSDEQFAQLLKVGYLAAKQANPEATVSFPGTSYWVDFQSKRPQFYDRILDILSQDPEAVANNYYHDATSLNLYRAPDDIFRVHSIFKTIQQEHGIDKPIWLTETNAMPSDDLSLECPHSDAPIPTTMDQQAAYGVQAFAMAAAAAYERIGFYQMIDQDPCAQPAVWGITRDDFSERPVSGALRTTIEQLSGFTAVHFTPYERATQAWSPWPEDPTSLLTNWQVYQVAFDKPGNERVTVLWNGDGSPLRARVRKNGTSATLVDRNGAPQPLEDSQGWWVMDLGGATAHYPSDPPGYYFIGGEPRFLIENGVDASTPVAAPALGEPGSVPRGFQLFVNPEGGQTVTRGNPADFFIRVRGNEGFSDPVSFSVTSWHSQRDPRTQSPSTLPLTVTTPENVAPGATARVNVQTAGAGPGIYFIELTGSGGGVSQQVFLALVVN